jgi:hypothetical protein
MLSGVAMLMARVSYVKRASDYCDMSLMLLQAHLYKYIVYVAIHALASMPSAPRLSEADSKTSTGVPCLYASTQGIIYPSSLYFFTKSISATIEWWGETLQDDSQKNATLPGSKHQLPSLPNSLYTDDP